MSRPEVAVGAMVERGDDLLLVRRGQPPGRGRWSVPGGRVEFGETLAEAVVREVTEETGIEVVVEGFLGWVERLSPPDAAASEIGPSDPSYHFVILDFRARPVDPSDTPRAGGDAEAAVWVDRNELPGLDLVDGLYEFLTNVGVIGRARTFEV